MFTVLPDLCNGLRAPRLLRGPGWQVRETDLLRKFRGVGALVVGAVLVLSGAAPAGSEPGAGDVGDRSLQRVPVARASGMGVVPGEVLVRYREGASRGERAEVRASAGARLKRRMRAGDWEVVRVPAGQEIGEAVAALERSGEVVEAVPNYRARILDTPDDPLFGLQWGLRNTGQSGGTAGADIDASTAWSTSTGDSSVVVAVVDTGVAYDHPDLAPNMWTNPGETGEGKETNGVDDDDNGYVDDWRGYDWYDGDNDPYDGNGHGTHVAGIVGARGNDGYGTAGVNWNVSIMPLRVLGGPDGSGTLDAIADAFAYAAANGAKVVNASLGSDGGEDVLGPTVTGASGTLFVAAAGNSASSNDAGPLYPCNLPAANLVCVAATDREDARAYYSNYGAKSVDLAAPGSVIASTWLPSITADPDESIVGEWAYLSGTSMAAPHVAGAAALVQAVRSSSAGRLRNVLLGSVDRLSSLGSLVGTGGRLNAYTAVRCASDLTAPGGQKVTGSALSAPFQTAKSFAVGWAASDGSGCGLHSYDVRYKRASSGSGFTGPGTWKSQVRSRSGTFAGSPGRTYCFGARARDKALNAAAWSSYRCTAIPVNNSSLSHSDGWRKKTGASGYYLNSYSLTKERGAKLKVRDVRFTKLALVATRCDGCGTVKVYRGSTLLKTVSLDSSRYRKRQVIPIKYYSSLARESTITIKVVSSGKPVRIEGLALSRV